MKCSFEHKPLPGEDEFLGDEHQCQFDVEQSKLLEVDGKAFCVFHCPVKDDSGNLTEKGSWDSDQVDSFNHDFLIATGLISEGEAKADLIGDFRGVAFPGDIDFSDVDFSTPVDFSNCQFYGSAWFLESNFTEDSNFSYSVFYRDASIF